MRERGFPDPLTARAAVTPTVTAIVDTQDGEAITYGALEDRVGVTAGRLARMGVEPGEHVGVLMETRRAFVRLVHAGLRIGTTLVPLNARLTPVELADQIDRADVVSLLCERDTSEAARAAATNVPVRSVDDWPQGTDPEPVPATSSSLTDRAFVLFTSGTTGRPKAVTVTRANLLASATVSAFRLGVLPEERWFLTLPMYHMGGLAPIIRSTLYGTTVILQETGGGFDPAGTLDALHAHEPTAISLVPTMLKRLLDAGELPRSLRFVLVGGAPTTSELLATCRDRNIPVCPTYGMTETASQIATVAPGSPDAYRGTVGRPLLGTTVRVVDGDGVPVPAGEPGELVVSGPTVTPGYYGDEASTREAFGEHGLQTGDIGYRDSTGRLWVLNRLGDRIVTGGENVDPGEVSEVLRSHPDIEDAVVVGLADATWGEQVAALLVAAELPDDLAGYLRDRLAEFKRPRTVAVTPALPRTASGTVDRQAVRERLRAARDDED